MRRFILFFAACLLVSAQPEADLARAAKSPYDLARYIDSHLNFDWTPAWKALGIAGTDVDYLIPCEQRGYCTTELITFLDPDQTILHIHDDIAWDTYLRYMGTNAKGWRFAGAYTPMFRYFQPRHETLRLGGKPFLRISTQGASGSDVGSEIEKWFDLSQPDFTPVFAFSPQGWGQDHFDTGSPWIAVNHRYHTSASIDEEASGEAIRLSVDVSFQSHDDDREYDLGSITYEGVYRREPGQKKFTLHRAYPLLDKNAPITNLRFDSLEGAVVLTDPEVLFYMLDRFKRIASGPDSPEKRWLKKYLAECPDTPEKRTLQALLR